jgi:hypothetical protein
MFQLRVEHPLAMSIFDLAPVTVSVLQAALLPSLLDTRS